MLGMWKVWACWTCWAAMIEDVRRELKMEDALGVINGVKHSPLPPFSMTRITDLRTLYMSHWEPTKCSTLTSVAISKGGAYFVVGDEYGNIWIGTSKTKQFMRSHHIEGCVNILFWIHLSSKPLLVAATTTGEVHVWQHNATNFTLRLQHTFEFCVHVLALNKENNQLAVSTGYDVHLYSNPLQAGCLPVPVKTWTGRTPPTNGQTFLKYPVAIGLHFTPLHQLFISYKAGYCQFKRGHTSLSPSGTVAVSGNLYNGFDIFSILDWQYTSGNNYLYTALRRLR
ncbi:hypothetical protein D9619_004935 [Psilocybe cf. subviscida]|uniref:Uncharacterized protein n=1 Tax=Psilocybe cf. subviscida TaxID=2480587 RepID=A0A8H5F8P3_9AGAR|nr:hypothetical protein D9619_004935 [Psilocybe cf. subviscida]